VRDPLALIENLQQARPMADIFTFLDETETAHSEYRFHKEIVSISILKIETFERWWKGLDFKVRNKIRKAHKSGVEIRSTKLDDDFVRGVEAIYNESPIRQNRKFWHYGKGFAEIKRDLSSFLDRTFFVGAYCKNELVGFMKLYQGDNILRTVHIIAKISQRDKPVQDALISKAVEICEQQKVTRLQYGNWSRGGLGAFKTKHGFERLDVPRYFAPLTLRGKLMLKLNLHRQFQDYLPETWMIRLIALRSGWNSMRYGGLRLTHSGTLAARVTNR
jgi:hypothetical protein